MLAPPDGAADALALITMVGEGEGVTTAETVGVAVTGGLGGEAGGLAGVVGVWQVQVGVGVGGGVWHLHVGIGVGVCV